MGHTLVIKQSDPDFLEEVKFRNKELLQEMDVAAKKNPMKETICHQEFCQRAFERIFWMQERLLERPFAVYTDEDVNDQTEASFSLRGFVFKGFDRSTVLALTLLICVAGVVALVLKKGI